MMTIKNLARLTAFENVVCYVHSGRRSTPLPVVDIGAMQHENPVAKFNVAQQMGKAGWIPDFYISKTIRYLSN